jgi:hypothetical protein
MFERTKIAHASFNLIVGRQPSIRRKANALEDALKDTYQPPLVVPIPDEVDPAIPRLVFTSRHGFSQIVASQVNLGFNVRFSDDWQDDEAKVRSYLEDRTKVLYDLVPILDQARPKYCGLSVVGRLTAPASDEENLAVLSRLLPWVEAAAVHGVEAKATYVVSGHYFRNIQVRNFRFIPQADEQEDIPPLPDGTATFRGVEVVCDCNDRRAYNEMEGYVSPPEAREVVIDLTFAGLSEAAAMLRRI